MSPRLEAAQACADAARALVDATQGIVTQLLDRAAQFRAAHEAEVRPHRRPETIRAPLTQAQIEGLEVWQDCVWLHPYTCKHDHKGKRVLVPTRRGLVCPTCGYVQDWALAATATGIVPPSPGELLFPEARSE